MLLPENTGTRSEQQLRNCLRTAETFPDREILHTLCAELSCLSGLRHQGWRVENDRY